MDITSYLLGRQTAGGGGGDTPDLSEYFETNLGAGSNWMSSIKQIPALTVNATSLSGFFSGYNGEELPEVTYTQDIISIDNFLVCQNLKTADLTGMSLDYENVFLDVLEEEGQINVQNTGLDNMGYECPQLAVLDISSFDFSQLTNDFKTYFEGRQMFYNVGRECLETDGAYADGMPLIYVKNAYSQAFVIEHGDYDESWDWDEDTGEEIYTKTLIWTTDNVVIKE